MPLESDRVIIFATLAEGKLNVKVALLLIRPKPRLKRRTSDTPTILRILRRVKERRLVVARIAAAQQVERR